MGKNLRAKAVRRTAWIAGVSALLGLLLLAAGCAVVGPDYKPPKTEVPRTWQGIEDPALMPKKSDIQRWWEVFHDPLLSRLIAEAARENLDVRVAWARVKEARAQVGVAAGAELPSLDAAGSSTWQRGSEHDITPGGVTDSSHRIGVDASWEIDLFGRIRRSIEAAEADYQATEEDRLDTLVTLYGEVALTYIEVRTLQARLEAARKNIASQREVLDLTRSRFKHGLATDLDVAQAVQVLASSEAELPPLRTALAQAVNNLALLLGKQPGAFRKELSKPAPIPLPPSKVAVGVPADILRQRPDVRRAERKLAAQTARIGVATADLYPSFSLTGSFGLSATEPGYLGRSGSYFFSVGPSFQWNIFDGGRIRSQIKVEDARTEQALLNYEQTVLSALNEVENAMVAFRQQRARLRALERTVQASRRTVSLALRLYKEGLKDFQSVLDAQRSLFSYDNQLAQAKGEVANNLVRLYKALGGGWRTGVKKTGDAKKKAPVQPASAPRK